MDLVVNVKELVIAQILYSAILTNKLIDLGQADVIAIRNVLEKEYVLMVNAKVSAFVDISKILEIFNFFKFN